MADSTGGGDRQGESPLKGTANSDQPIGFGPYTQAIVRWGKIVGRDAPPVTEPNRSGGPRLSARFVEWMMGLPDGWVTDVNLTYSQKLRLLGNSVVPQQGAAALRHLLDAEDRWCAEHQPGSDI